MARSSTTDWPYRCPGCGRFCTAYEANRGGSIVELLHCDNCDGGDA